MILNGNDILDLILSEIKMMREDITGIRGDIMGIKDDIEVLQIQTDLTHRKLNDLTLDVKMAERKISDKTIGIREEGSL